MAKETKETKEEGIQVNLTQARNIAIVLTVVSFVLVIIGWFHFNWNYTLVLGLVCVACGYLAYTTNKAVKKSNVKQD